jgi:hypothetical protein
VADIKSPTLLWIKAGLFVFVGAIAAALVLIESPTWRTALLLAVCVWAFCRAYYFAFYVIGRYADPSYRFSGLIDFARYAVRRRRAGGSADEE